MLTQRVIYCYERNGTIYDLPVEPDEDLFNDATFTLDNDGRVIRARYPAIRKTGTGTILNLPGWRLAIHCPAGHWEEDAKALTGIAVEHQPKLGNFFRATVRALEKWAEGGAPHCAIRLDIFGREKYSPEGAELVANEPMFAYFVMDKKRAADHAKKWRGDPQTSMFDKLEDAASAWGTHDGKELANMARAASLAGRPKIATVRKMAGLATAVMKDVPKEAIPFVRKSDGSFSPVAQVEDANALLIPPEWIGRPLNGAYIMSMMYDISIGEVYDVATVNYTHNREGGPPMPGPVSIRHGLIGRKAMLDFLKGE